MVVAPWSPRGCEKITIRPTPIQTSYFIGSCNLHYLLFSGIGQVTFSAGKYLRLCWREGWGVDVVVLITFWNTHIFLRLVKIIIRILQPFLRFFFH